MICDWRILKLCTFIHTLMRFDRVLLKHIGFCYLPSPRPKVKTPKMDGLMNKSTMIAERATERPSDLAIE